MAYTEKMEFNSLPNLRQRIRAILPKDRNVQANTIVSEGAMRSRQLLVAALIAIKSNDTIQAFNLLYKSWNEAMSFSDIAWCRLVTTFIIKILHNLDSHSLEFLYKMPIKSGGQLIANPLVKICLAHYYLDQNSLKEVEVAKCLDEGGVGLANAVINTFYGIESKAALDPPTMILSNCIVLYEYLIMRFADTGNYTQQCSKFCNQFVSIFSGMRIKPDTNDITGDYCQFLNTAIKTLQEESTKQSITKVLMSQLENLITSSSSRSPQMQTLKHQIQEFTQRMHQTVQLADANLDEQRKVPSPRLRNAFSQGL